MSSREDAIGGGHCPSTPTARLGCARSARPCQKSEHPALDVELWIKRDDCTGLAFGGNKVRQLEALFLDPVYTGKAMAGLIAHVRAGRIAAGSRVLFLHTGGLPALFAYADKLGPWVLKAPGAAVR